MTRFRTLIDALCSAPADRPFITFWIDEGEQETVTFGQFRERARSQAALLRGQAVGVGDCVVIIMPQGIASMATFAGAMMLGAAPAFLAYPNFKVEPAKYRAGLAGVTGNLRAKIVVIDHDFPGELLAHVSLNEETNLLRTGEATRVQLEDFSPAQIEPESIAFIQHSAGTTGLQKGVALTHAAVLKQLDSLAAALRMDATSDRIYSWLPLYHDMGLIACFMLPMFCHVPVVMQSPLDWVMHPETMLQIITEHRCTLAWMPNFAFQFVPRRAPQNRWAKCDSLRALINCSEPVRASSMEEFRHAFTSIGLKASALHSSYAMAENVFAVTQSDVGAPQGPTRVTVDARRFRNEHKVVPVDAVTPGSICFVSSGRLLPHNRVRIASESGETFPDAQVGEILIQSDCLFSGYYNRPDLTAQAIVDGWYHTGDLGFLLDGELYVVGRKKDLLIIGGENIYPQDIEEMVSAHPAICDGRVVALGVYNRDLGTEEIFLVAEVEDEKFLIDPQSIEQELRAQVVAGLGLSVRTIFLKPPRWIVKSTAGKPARASTSEKLLREHPELLGEA